MCDRSYRILIPLQKIWVARTTLLEESADHGHPGSGLSEGILCDVDLCEGFCKEREVSKSVLFDLFDCEVGFDRGYLEIRGQREDPRKDVLDHLFELSLVLGFIRNFFATEFENLGTS